MILVAGGVVPVIAGVFWLILLRYVAKIFVVTLIVGINVAAILATVLLCALGGMIEVAFVQDLTQEVAAEYLAEDAEAEKEQYKPVTVPRNT